MESEKNKSLLKENIELKKKLEQVQDELDKLKNQEKINAESINGYDVIYQNTTVGLYKTTPDGEILDANNSLLEMLGFDSLDELKKYNLEDFDLLSYESRKVFKEAMEKNGKIVGNETLWYKKNGEKVYIKESAKEVKNENGIVKYYVGTVENISKQRESEKKLAENEYRYRSLVDFFPEGIAIHKDLKIIYINRQGLNYVKLETKKDVVGKSIFNFIHKDFHAIVKDRMTKLDETTSIAEPIEQVFVRADGKEIDVEVTTKKVLFYGEKVMLSIFRDISYRKEFEEKLKTSEETFKGILNSISEAIFIQDIDGTFLNINETAETLFGYSKDELIGKTQKMLAAPKKNNLKKVDEYIADTFKNNTNHRFEFVGKTKNEKILHVEVSLSSNYYFNNKAVIAVIRDISEQKEAEIKIFESEKKYRDLINFAVGGILVGCSKGFILEANDHICNLMGRKKEDIVGKHISDGFFTEESLLNAPLDFESLKAGKSVINEREIIRPDGTSLWVEMHTKQLPNKNYQSIYHDITDRKTAEKELIRSKRIAESLNIKRASLLRAIPDMMFTFDKFGYIIDFYSNTEEDLFMPKEFFLKKNVMEVLPRSVGEVSMEAIKNAIKTKKIQTHTYSLNVNGKEQFFDARLVALDSKSVLSVVRNVTERIDLIEELKAAKEKAEEGQRLSRAFLTNLSHEIRTPMNGILGFTELLKDDELSKSEREEYLSIIEKSGSQLIGILNDIIELSKIEAGVIKANKSRINLNQFINNIYKVFDLGVRSKSKSNIKFNIDIPEQEVSFTSDKIKLQQIVSNLLSNAFKFTKKGEVQLGAKLDGKNILFYVKDTGFGIDEKYYEIIFDRFSQAPDNKTLEPVEGSGLGLSICKAYVELLGGNIYVESKINKGSKFSFIIPRI